MPCQYVIVMVAVEQLLAMQQTALAAHLFTLRAIRNPNEKMPKHCNISLWGLDPPAPISTTAVEH